MTRFRELQFYGEWRPYQRAALAAFEKDRHNGRLRTHIVAPPGSGKTLLGVELIRRVGKRALVLAPNQGIQQQWPRAVASFTDRPEEVAGADPLKPIACLSYQALCQLEDPEILLGRLAQSRWADERAAATGMTREEALREGEAFEGEAANRRARELARISAALKREVARGEHAGVELRDLLSEPARKRVQQLANMGVGVVLLDECHHLASLWGYVVRAVLQELPEGVHVIGLTATPPVSLPEAEAELYDALLGPVDFTVPTPAVVRDGHLAPYQELAILTEPLQAERDWLAEHDTRFRELITALHDGDFPEWVIGRLHDRRRSAEDETELSWPEFQRRSPKLARAGVRFLLSADLRVPTGAPRGEAYRRRPDLDDWLVLLEDYALRKLASDPSREAADQYEAIAAALRELGFNLTRQGIRRGTSEVDRLLTGSQAKAHALVDVLAHELEHRGERTRALVLTDAELAAQRPDDALTGVLDPAAGTARHVLLAIAADDRVAHLRPLLVSGRGLRCHPADAEVLLTALEATAQDHFKLTDWEAEPDGLLVTLHSQGAEWMPRAWVELATRLFVEGTTQVLVGTRALLGEGWNCPPLNVLIDMTIATTGVSVQQMRGRSLRLDPADPQKVASNWDVVCVAPDLVRGNADYERFVRKHLNLFAPAEDGEVEAGPSHVHPELGPFGPPPVERFRELNAQLLQRAAQRDAARERWKIGTPYRGVELPTLLVRRRSQAPAPKVTSKPGRPLHLSQRVPIGTGLGGGAAFGALGVAASAPPLLIGLALAPAGLAWAAVRLGAAKQRLPLVLPLDAAARAVIDAYRELDELTPEAANSLTIEPRASGYLRCELTRATAEEGKRFATALDELVSLSDNPRYLVSRPLADPRRGPLGLLGRVLTRRPPFDERLHPVPADLARNKERAEAFARASRRHMGPGRLVFTQRSEEGHEARAEAASADGGYETLVRDVWV
ncbi:DEAD/DEAH box helicase family protein [Solirubrobacter sp. CPCC 204708]|uniref:DEAD/DEAH box helicase family protein n=1 Tax=Solirubrobacter deserti TaxID=2282478 RepID=A0ABT4RMX1_9ACTN|nr:DEAD/DEAH box helicase family protein [Solirubrobacter deserti]MBE2320156.1 DEAD/DEAH box helicase family protein [Solirubrobacter deserti]MDA0139876.1 DEAD/DEAH box helicase family protein [Solirubrobacter deserti]